MLMGFDMRVVTFGGRSAANERIRETSTSRR
jgi:hypothetical protein